MKKIGSFFKLVRWPNLLITAMMMCLVYHCVMMMESTAAFTLLVISMVFVVAGGYVINDIFDVETDAINKPKKLIVGKIFSEKQCNVFYLTLTVIGLCCALASTIIAYGTKFYLVFICMLLLAGVLYSYSSTYKKKLLIGNIIVSLSVAFAVFLPWLFEMLYMSEHTLLLSANENLMTASLRIVLYYTGFAFLTTLIREIVKDLEDIDGDERSGCRTMPIAWGMKTSNVIVAVMLFLLAGLMIGFTIFTKNLSGSEAATFLIRLTYVFALMSLIRVFNARKAKMPRIAYHQISTDLKVIMLVGVLSMFFISII